MPPRQNRVAIQFGGNLRRCRHATGLSQERLSVLASLHRNQISLLETGAREPKLGTLIKVAGTLPVPVRDLLEGIAWRPPRRGAFEFQLTHEAAAPSTGAPSKWMANLTEVEETVLSEVIYRHPEYLGVNEFCRRIAADPGDDREIEVCTTAIENLKKVRLLRPGNDDAIEPTDAALRAAGLFMGCICETDECHCQARFRDTQTHPSCSTQNSSAITANLTLSDRTPSKRQSAPP